MNTKIEVMRMEDGFVFVGETRLRENNGYDLFTKLHIGEKRLRECPQVFGGWLLLEEELASLTIRTERRVSTNIRCIFPGDKSASVVSSETFAEYLQNYKNTHQYDVDDSEWEDEDGSIPDYHIQYNTGSGVSWIPFDHPTRVYFPTKVLKDEYVAWYSSFSYEPSYETVITPIEYEIVGAAPILDHPVIRPVDRAGNLQTHKTLYTMEQPRTTLLKKHLVENGYLVYNHELNSTQTLNEFKGNPKARGVVYNFGNSSYQKVSNHSDASHHYLRDVFPEAFLENGRVDRHLGSFENLLAIYESLDKQIGEKVREYAVLHDVILAGVPAQEVYVELARIISYAHTIRPKRSDEVKMLSLRRQIVELRNSLAKYVAEKE